MPYFESALRFQPIERNLSSEPQQERSFEINEKLERVLFRASEAVLEKLYAVAEVSKQELLDLGRDPIKKGRLIAERLKILWPENDGGRPKPQFELGALEPALGGIRIKFEPIATGGGYYPSTKEVSIGLGTLVAAESEEAFAEALDWIQDVVHHEVEHIAFHGDGHNPGDRDEENTVKYLTSTCEMRAHAKQFAVRYQHAFPGQAFDPKKMIAIASRFTRGGERCYFELMRDPELQARYPDLPIADTNKNMISLCTRLVEIL